MGGTMTLDQIIQIAVGVGTIAVAILAIWGDQVRHRLGLGLRLTLLLDDPLGELIDISEGTGIRTPARYYHLRVRNSHGWSQATNVRVVITGLAKPAADGSMVTQPLSGPLQLMWRFSSYHPSYSIVGPDDGNQRMQVVLKAIADNAESPFICIEVSWDGQWADDTLEMAKHLVVKQVEAPTTLENGKN